MAAGDVMAEIETDKATIEWEAQEEGILAKILVQEGVPDVPCGTPVALIVEQGTDVSAFANFDPSSASKQPPPSNSKPAAAPAATPASSFPPHMKLQMPSLSPTMEQVGSGNFWSIQPSVYS